MRIAIAFSLVFGAIFLTSAAVTAAPLALSDHAAVTKAVGDAETRVEPVGWRARARRCARRYAPSGNRTCYPYWRPYQYYNWQYYYPYGGPLF